MTAEDFHLLKMFHAPHFRVVLLWEVKRKLFNTPCFACISLLLTQTFHFNIVGWWMGNFIYFSEFIYAENRSWKYQVCFLEKELKGKLNFHLNLIVKLWCYYFNGNCRRNYESWIRKQIKIDYEEKWLESLFGAESLLC